VYKGATSFADCCRYTSPRGNGNVAGGYFDMLKKTWQALAAAAVLVMAGLFAAPTHAGKAELDLLSVRSFR